jgi:hypothetical protein
MTGTTSGAMCKTPATPGNWVNDSVADAAEAAARTADAMRL